MRGKFSSWRVLTHYPYALVGLLQIIGESFVDLVDEAVTVLKLFVSHRPSFKLQLFFTIGNFKRAVSCIVTMFKVQMKLFLVNLFSSLCQSKTGLAHDAWLHSCEQEDHSGEKEPCSVFVLFDTVRLGSSVSLNTCLLLQTTSQCQVAWITAMTGFA